MTSYRHAIDALVKRLAESTGLSIDPDSTVEGRTPTSASSEFLTNKQQGDWAERLIQEAINSDPSGGHVAMPYGRSDGLSAGDEGFPEFYADYLRELNDIGKKPDLLIFKKEDLTPDFDINLAEHVARAVAAIEVRSSSFLAKEYAIFMQERTRQAIDACMKLKVELTVEPYASLLKSKRLELYEFLQTASEASFKGLDFRLQSWRTTPDLRDLSDKLRKLKDNISVLHKRDHLSITPKVEDIVLVHRWIQRFNVPHHYLQVFFDKACIISFHDILSIASDPEREGVDFAIESDVKNQGKSTIKINIDVGKEMLSDIEMPTHNSAIKHLARGRLLFYVEFSGGKGHLSAENTLASLFGTAA